MGLYDVHAHLTHPRLRGQEAEVLDRARRAGLTSIVANGLNPADNEAVKALAARSELVRPAFGLYPVDAVLPEMLARGIETPRDEEEEAVPADEAVAWVREHVGEAFAVGEIGLDGYWVPEELWARQEAVFRELVQVALDARKPVIVHTRKREQRAFEVLKEMGVERVNWHCFTSKLKLAKRIAEEGHFLSIPANVVKSELFQRMLETLPRDRLLLETDCPYLGPVRGETNEPANVAITLDVAARAWGCSREAALEQLEQNFEVLFGVAP